MVNRKKGNPLIDAEGEVRELTAADLARFKPARDVLPSKLTKKLDPRGHQKSPAKKLVSLRLSPEVLAHYKATGRGWQTRIDQTLKREVAKSERYRSR